MNRLLFFPIIVSACISFLFGLPPSACADGFRNPFHDASAIAQGNAFAAQADNASAVFYNPAAMTQLHGLHTAGGMQFVSINTTFTSPIGTTTNNSSPAVGLPPPGQFFVTANLKDLRISALGNLSVGLGILNLYGFAAKFPTNGPFATAVTFAQLPLIAIKPTVAYKVTESLSVGLGADIYTFTGLLGEGHAERRFQAAPGSSFTPGTELELNGKGTTAGLNVSVLYTLWRTDEGKPRLSIAGIWRSQAVLPLNGDLLANGVRVAGASTSIRLPEVWTGGIAYWPVRNRSGEWKVEVDVDYVRWQAIRDASAHLSDGSVLPSPQQWRNTFTVNVGTEYKLLGITSTQGWDVAFRTGYIRSHSPVTDRSFDPAFADNDAHVATVGMGVLCHGGGKLLGVIACADTEKSLFATSAIGLDLFYEALVFDTRTVSDSPNPTVNGTYRTTNHAGGATFRINF
ncbi:OmpP1/FadL family transporter [Candidatus Nitrospira nitrificans]|uniref:Putative long-chain fatty acid outer membrane transporter n=1 Tax=Candidatus Nitrospira nitrificans TaxID=1742973 RepID=A0A0S4L1I4_9BACT|nr:outer membrane protein transport protein [Candidatus Nitrospira nitrificans]CUS31349.1 putative long-chain fatty acid outer membrane transporter [Candidatus Nitrospira nitrificans]